jgi:leader peptidase (prepilin peptidase)/N-methyltransferase
LIEIAIAVVFGLLFGSFLNVCIYRLPRDLSVVWPGSHCLSCSHTIAPYDNIPVLSYLLLRGRCRHCRSAIYWRYPVVEALTACLFGLGVWMWGPTGPALKFAVFAFLQVGMIFSDYETRLLPDEFTKGGIVLGLIASALVPLKPGIVSMLLPAGQDSRVISSLIESGFTAVFISVVLWVPGQIMSRIRKKEMLGFGDVKMVAMIGAFLGVMPVMATIFVACVAGTVVGVGYIWLSGKDLGTYELPFASFLGAAAILVALFGM